MKNTLEEGGVIIESFGLVRLAYPHNVQSNSIMKVKIKKLVPEAVVPAYAHETDACVDLVAVSKVRDVFNVIYGTGLAVEIPEGNVGLIFPRSSNAKKRMWLTNHVGVIDSGYRGEIKVKFRLDGEASRDIARIATSMLLTPKDREESVNLLLENYEYNIGDRIGQLMIIPYPKIEFEEVEELSETDRGEGGFGSTGK